MMWHPERAGEELPLVPVRLPLALREGTHDHLVPAERRQNKGRLHPQQESRVTCLVWPAVLSRAADRSVHSVDPAQGALGSRALTEHDGKGRVDGAQEPGQRGAPKVRVLIDPRGDQWMRDLHEQRRCPAEEQEALTVDAPSDRSDLEDASVAHTRSVLLRSFQHALAGALYIIRTQRNARIEIVIGVVAIGVASWLGFSPIEWAVLALTITVVVGLEWINTALELAVTLASPERHPMAKAAKDVSAAVVLVGAIGSVVVGLFLFGPRLAAMFRP